MDKIKNNSPVLFYFNHSKKWLMKISKKESFHTHIGVIKHSDAIGKEIWFKNNHKQGQVCLCSKTHNV